MTVSQKRRPRRHNLFSFLRADAFRQDESGSAAIETALVAPAFLALLIGIIQSGLMVYTKASLHYAVQKHVRCLAIKASCPSATTHYFAPGTAPVFTDTPPSASQKCQAVTGTVTYNFNLGFFQRNVSLSSTACFPYIYGTSAT